MASILKVGKDNLGNILTTITLLGLAANYLATKNDVKLVNTNVSMLRLELTIRVNENKLATLDKVEAKTPSQEREIAALTASNIRLTGKIEDTINGED